MIRKDDIPGRLFSLADPGYRDFSASLMPGVARERVIGVRTPALRQLARELWGTPTAEAFLLDLPHHYFEENQLHAFLCEREGDVAASLARCQKFLPYIDNWATCDQFAPRAFARSPEALSDVLPVWLTSDHPYTVRYAILARMRYFLSDERFSPRYPEEIAGVRMGWHYYVDMAVAWYFATAAAKQEEAARPFLLALPPAVRNKAHCQGAGEFSRSRHGQRGTCPAAGARRARSASLLKKASIKKRTRLKKEPPGMWPGVLFQCRVIPFCRTCCRASGSRETVWV